MGRGKRGVHPQSSVTSVAISEDGGRVVSASLELDGTVKAWDPPPRPERAVALAMGHHARLGAESPVLALEEGLLRLLAQHAAAGAWGESGALSSSLADRAAPQDGSVRLGQAAFTERGYPAGETGQDGHGEESSSEEDRSQPVTPLCKEPHREAREREEARGKRAEERRLRKEELEEWEKALLLEELELLRLREQVHQAR